MITVAQSTSFDANTGDESKSVLTSLVSYMDASTGVISLSTSATLSDVLSAGSVNVSEATLTTLAQANNFATQSLSRVGDLQKSIVGQMLNVNAASVDEALQNIQEMLTAVANNKTLLDVTFVDGQSVGYELGRLTTFTDSPEIKIDLSKIKSHLAVNDTFTIYDDRHDSINLRHDVTRAEIDQGFFKLTFPASSVSQFDSVVLRLNVTTRDGTDGVGLFTFTKDTLPRDGTAIQEANLAASTSGKFALATGVTTQAQANAAGDHGYGSFTVKSDGAWSYVMNSAHNEFA
ncbi:MAG: hypothetical protein EBQ84_08700, partial [Betaproteobacteria bacterium]|nr:hypothetical protein [Betaproteobacteria bacterium]